MLTVFRLVTPQFTASAFSGEGARLYGGRWNSKGVPMVYTASTISLALLEMKVQANSMTPRYACIAAEIPDDVLVMELSPENLRKDWRGYGVQDLQEIGDQWIAEGKSAILMVPSAVVPMEFNYLINPAHDDFKMIRIGDPFDFNVDQRLIKS